MPKHWGAVNVEKRERCRDAAKGSPSRGAVSVGVGAAGRECLVRSWGRCSADGGLGQGGATQARDATLGLIAVNAHSYTLWWFWHARSVADTVPLRRVGTGALRMRVWILGTLLAVWSGVATAEGCPKDRTPLEMARHVLCLPTDAMPNVRRDENGDVISLSWDKLDQISHAKPVPYGSLWLFIQSIEHQPPPFSKMDKSNLPGMMQLAAPRSSFLYPVDSRLWGNVYEIYCRDALAPVRKERGDLDCDITSKLTDTLRVEVVFVTGLWSRGSPVGKQAWPDLDANWQESWPAYIENLETGINNLISLQ